MLPWPRDPRAPRGSRRAADLPRASADPGPPEPPAARIARIRAKAPLLLALATEPIRQAKAATEAAQLARARRVGRDLGVVNRSDYGHGIRLVPIRGPDRAILREADVVVADAPDPDMPNVTVRRARRTDPLEVLKRAGTINAREHEAGEKLRDAIEQSQPSLPGVSRSEVHVAPWNRVAISERQLKACRACAVPLPRSTMSWPQRCCGSCATAGRSGAMRPSRMCAIRQRLNCCAAVSARWPITTSSPSHRLCSN